MRWTRHCERCDAYVTREGWSTYSLLSGGAVLYWPGGQREGEYPSIYGAQQRAEAIMASVKLTRLEAGCYSGLVRGHRVSIIRRDSHSWLLQIDLVSRCYDTMSDAISGLVRSLCMEVEQ